MNKRFSQFFLAAVMAFAMLLPMFSQSANAQTTPTNSNDNDVNVTVTINQFNRRALAFSQLVTNANSILGQDRLIFLLAADLGVPVGYIRAALASQTTPIDQLMLSFMLSDATNIPVERIFSLFQSGNSFGQIAIQINVDGRVINIMLTGLQNAILDEINSGGNVNSLNDLMTAKLARAITLMQSKFTSFQTILGRTLFSDLVLRRLALDTGMSFDDLRNQFMTAGFGLSLNQFTLGVLLENILTAASGYVVDRRLIIGPNVIIEGFNQSNLPVALFITRLDRFMRVVGTSVTRNPKYDTNDSTGQV